MPPVLQPIPLKEYDRTFLQAIYDRYLQGKKFDTREIMSGLFARLPAGFNPAHLYKELVDPLGPKLRLLGIISLQGNIDCLRKCHDIIIAIQEMVIADSSLKTIDTYRLPDKVGLPLPEISMYLECINEYGRFWGSASFEQNSPAIITLDISREEQIFLEYFQYTTMETLIERHMVTMAMENESDITSFKTDDADTIFERKSQYVSVCGKLDELLARFEGSEKAREALGNELKELKDLYFKVNKKNWKQAVKGKLLDLALAKLIENDTLSLLYHAITNEYHHFIR
jgi:hypothetical protein